MHSSLQLRTVSTSLQQQRVLHLTLTLPVAHQGFKDEGLEDYAHISIEFDQEKIFDHEEAAKPKYLGSWQRLKVSEPNGPLLIEVIRCIDITNSHAFMQLWVHAYAPVKPCTFGDVMEVALGLQELLKSSDVEGGEIGRGWVGLGDYGVSEKTVRLLNRPARWKHISQTVWQRPLNWAIKFVPWRAGCKYGVGSAGESLAGNRCSEEVLETAGLCWRRD